MNSTSADKNGTESPEDPEPPSDDHDAGHGSETAPLTSDVNHGVSPARLLGSQTAFQLDGESLAGIGQAIRTSSPVPAEYYGQLKSSMETVAAAAAAVRPEIPFTALKGLHDAAAKIAVPTEALEGLRSAMAASAKVNIPTESLAGIQAALAASAKVTIPTDTFAGLQAALRTASQGVFSDGYWERFGWTVRALEQSVSVPSLYSQDQLASRSNPHEATVRGDRSAEAFFDAHSVEIDDERSLIKALATILEKHHKHQLVWRGQQDVSWQTHSSLYRKLEKRGPVSEDRLVSAEALALDHARTWGEDPVAALKFFAHLQHQGAPTRLLDATMDPEMAAWFAVEADPDLDDVDGRVIAWGRVARTSARKLADADEDLPADEKAPFWHAWASEDQRARVGWGTGSRTWSWFPPALSDRMRAQRAGFLLEAGPLVTPTVAEVISAAMGHEWRVGEITRATSIVGFPSRHDVITKPNEAHLVPLFSLRITARAKPAIRRYLAGKGLRFSTVYPDRGGLVEFLKGPLGIQV
ncbi:FRG domain-containing protein [Plantibacter sp. CFBP 8775]|uniref:FRG domain-containing protein n=1 Tax=Plantibacter sp. CFBP 8775 TaxID=2774038 RepID=UPI00177EB252|nr:FRG domain-containing protein [Plantibacter sp. CFBP 8775]